MTHKDQFRELRTELGPYWPLKILGMAGVGLTFLVVWIYLFALLELALWH